MDIIAHGLYGGAGFVNKSKKSFWTAFFFGILPDLSAFGPLAVVFLTTNRFNDLAGAEPPRVVIPQYVHTIYSFSHSLLVFAAVFVLVWLLFRRPIYEMLAWPLHILMDIPSHTSQYFPTPFLFPLSSFRVDGISWHTGWFFAMYWLVIIAIYGIQLIRRRRRVKI